MTFEEKFATSFPKIDESNLICLQVFTKEGCPGYKEDCQGRGE